MHPILLTLGDSFFIGTYGLFIAVGLLVAIQVGAVRLRRRGLPGDVMFDLGFVAVVSGFVGARILYILLNFGEFMDAPRAMLFSRTGFVFLGGFIGAVGACIAYLKWKKLPILDVGDVTVASLAIGHAFGRIGCHFAGCCWGGVCRVPGVGVEVERHLQPDGYPFVNAYESQMADGLIPPDALSSLPVWPVQLMESAGLFLLAGALIWFGRKARPAGQSLALYLIVYAALRFGLEFLRGDLERGMFGALSTSQIISLLMLPVGAGLFVWTKGRPKSPHSAPRKDNTPEDDAREGKDEKTRGKKKAAASG